MSYHCKLPRQLIDKAIIRIAAGSTQKKMTFRYSLRGDLDSWLKSMVSHDFHIVTSTVKNDEGYIVTNHVIIFDDPNDALLFKLAWHTD